jgi:hypothetical protein
MATETPTTPARSAPRKKSNLVPILIVVGVLVVVAVGLGIFLLRDSGSSSTAVTGAAPPKLAKDLYQAWQSGDRAAAATSADPAAVTAIFAFPASQGTGLVFGGCTKDGTGPLPKTCVFSRPGGELKLTVSKVGDKRSVTAVTLGPAATTPTSPTG